MTSYNLARFIEELLEAHQSSPPSFIVKLYPDYWTLNNGSKCLYNNHMASLLDDIRAQRIPVDFLELFDIAKLPFYDGCMIVELQDFRPPKPTDPTLEEPHKTRVALTPNSETLWADICLLNQKVGNVWTDREALEVEARIVLMMSPPLCLEPDPHLARVANSVARTSVPAVPLSLKRKAAVMEQEDDEAEKARRAKLAQFMNPKYTKPTVTAPNYRILDVIERVRRQKAQTAAAAARSAPVVGPMPPPIAIAAPMPAPAVAQVPVQYPPQAVVAPPPQLPTTVPIPAPSSTPVSQSALTPQGTPSGAHEKKKMRRSEAGQSPVASTSRMSATPGSSTVPLPPHIPAHLQPHYPSQNGVPTPPRHSQSPHPVQNIAAAHSPQRLETRPPSVAQPRTPQPVSQVSPATSQPSIAIQPPPTAAITLPQHAQNANYAIQSALSKRKATQPSAPVNGSVAPNHAQNQMQIPPQFYAQIQAYQRQQQQQQQQNAQHLSQQQGPSASSASRSPATAVQGTTPQRNSPLAASQRLTHSPMPPSAAQAAHVAQQINYNYAMQNPYNPAAAAHLRPVAHGHAPHPQMMPHQMAASGAQAAASTGPQAGPVASQEQTQAAQMMAQYPHLYSYQMGLNVQTGRPMYWPVGMARGAPMMNGQHQMPGMAGRPQQMQLGANKAVQGGVQGS